MEVLDHAFREFAERPAVRLHAEASGTGRVDGGIGPVDGGTGRVRGGVRPAEEERQADAGPDGTSITWTYAELDRRSRLAGWRLRAMGLRPGDRILTWSPSTPALPAAYIGAMRAGVIFVPLDLRMAPDAIHRIGEVAGVRALVLGSGRDAPDPAAAGLEALSIIPLDDLVAEPGPELPADWAAQMAGWERPRPEDLVTLIFTSGTTGTPKGVMLAHNNLVAALGSYDRVLPRLEHRVVSLLPLSHLFELLVGLLYVLSVGADVRYVQSRNPRVIFDALRRQRVTSMIAVPQILELFWTAVEREVDRIGRRRAFDRLRWLARRLPASLRRRLFRSVHSQLGGGLRLFVCSGAFLPPAIQQAWEDLGVTVMQGYGATETASGTCTTLQDHGIGTVGRPAAPVEIRLASDAEVLFRGPTLFKGYWNNPEATAAAFDEEGWYHSGDMGRFDAQGRLILMGRKRDMIVLSNGLNVFPEDVENTLRMAGIHDAILVEPRPGRLEAVVLAGEADGEVGDEQRARLGAMVKAANARLGQHQRVDGWRLWPEPDFPRTHTLKVKRAPIAEWAAAQAAAERPG